MNNLLGIGAEAVVKEQRGSVVKDRVKKNYRLRVIDDKLRGTRTRKEAKILGKLSAIGFPCPKVLKQDESKIQMSLIVGKQVKAVLTNKNQAKLCKEIGVLTATMHDLGIIHGDLTTSNMIFDGKKIYFIDFGLSFESPKVEDKAVDLHLFRQALESKHFEFSDLGFQSFLKGYNKSKNFKEVLARFKIVESRGRNKESY